MAMQKGETYRCTNADCGCEVKVTQGAQRAENNQGSLQCCCGTNMEKVS